VREARAQIAVRSVAVVVPVERVEEELHVDGVRADPHHRQRLAQVRERKRAVRDLLVIPEREELLQVVDTRVELEREVGDGRERHAQSGRSGPRTRHQNHAPVLLHPIFSGRAAPAPQRG
jgi:hypothetical protein